MYCDCVAMNLVKIVSKYRKLAVLCLAVGIVCFKVLRYSEFSILWMNKHFEVAICSPCGSKDLVGINSDQFLSKIAIIEQDSNHNRKLEVIDGKGYCQYPDAKLGKH